MNNKEIDLNSFSNDDKTNRNQNEMEDSSSSSSSSSLSPPVIELERVYASIGETINLTCYLYTKEVDWHFKDRNLTTTIISNGLQLQVTQQLLFVSSTTNNNNNNYIIDDDNFEQQRRLRQRRRFQHDGGVGDRQNRRHSTKQKHKQKLLKYKVTSDLHFTHMLGVYVEGEQDEGSYQCIDSVSETPVKKTIVVILKNNSQALKSMGSPKADTCHFVMSILFFSLVYRIFLN